MARPKGTTKLELNPDLQTRIVTYIQAGSYVETAAAAAGICKDTFYAWLKRGAAGEEPFKGFSDAVEKAAAEAEVRDLAVVDKAARGGTWQAAAWKLERRNPKAWGRRTVRQPAYEDGQDPVLKLLAAMTEDESTAEDLTCVSEEDLVTEAERLMGEVQAAIDRTGRRPHPLDPVS